jgi:hypothetical protein
MTTASVWIYHVLLTFIVLWFVRATNKSSTNTGLLILRLVATIMYEIGLAIIASCFIAVGSSYCNPALIITTIAGLLFAIHLVTDLCDQPSSKNMHCLLGLHIFMTTMLTVFLCLLCVLSVIANVTISNSIETWTAILFSFTLLIPWSVYYFIWMSVLLCCRI